MEISLTKIHITKIVRVILAAKIISIRININIHQDKKSKIPQNKIPLTLKFRSQPKSLLLMVEDSYLHKPKEIDLLKDLKA